MHLKNHILYSVIGLAFICGFASSSAAYADESTVDAIDITVPSSCTFGAGGGGTYSVTMNSNDTEVITANSITITCNDSSGYAIYAIGFSGDSYYGNNTDLISTLGSSYNIKTDGTGTYGSSWKMKITAVTNATVEGSYGTFQNIPATYTKVASFNTNTTSGTITPSYQINVSSTQPADTFEGQVKYTLVHPATAVAPILPLRDTDCPANSICYAPNASDIDGSMSSLGTTTDLANATSSKGGKVSATYNTDKVLIAPNFSRPGYGFAGWSTDFEATSSSTIYGPNETITVPDVSSHGLILYPVWIASAGNLQGWSCSNSNLTQAPTSGRATLASMTALKDTRDNNVYAVAKLADGKCWMVENLRLDNTATITTTNTHNPLNTNSNVTLTIDYANNTTADHLAASSNTWCQAYSSSCDDQTMLNTNNINRTLGSSYNGTGDTTYYQWYSYGNYYNWYSATAGNGTYSSSNNNGSMTGDLCPAGWQLPKGGDKNNSANSDFWALAVASIGAEPANTSSETRPTYTGNPEGNNASKVSRQFPNNFVYSGYFSDSSAEDRNSKGSYWSSSASSISVAYSFVIHSNSVGPGIIYYGKSTGLTVRCIAQ